VSFHPKSRWVRFGSCSVAIATLIVACGSRTGLDPGDLCAEGVTDCALADAQNDAPGDHTVTDVRLDGEGPRDATHDGDGPLFEGGPLDVVTDCAQPAFCDPSDPGFIYKCGVRIFECSSLEQCVLQGAVDAGPGDDASSAGTATCVNPCLDTLGQDTSNGCEFFAGVIDTEPTTIGACYAVFIVNQWKTGEPARIEIDRGGATLPIEQFTRIPVGKGTQIAYAPYSAAQGLAKDQIAIMFLSANPALAGTGGDNSNVLAQCPDGIIPAVVPDAAIHGTGIGTAFHIKTNVPVVGYQMIPYGGGRARVTSATLLLPTNVWDRGFVAANAHPQPSFGGPPPPDNYSPTMMILARDDATQVTINPVTAILGGAGVAPAPAGAPVTYTVGRGQYLQISQPLELTGSPIVSDKPIAVIGGSTFMQVPTGRQRADTGQQMLPPVSALGSEYAAVRFRQRATHAVEIVPWRIVGVVDGTQLTWEPQVPPGAPTVMNARQFVEFNSEGQFVVRSQDAAHPFYMAGYMTGGDTPPYLRPEPDAGATAGEDPNDGEGDSEFVNLVPPAQYLPRYTFFTDPTYPETNLVVTRVKDATLGFPEVSLDCTGTLGGWTDLGTGGVYQYTRVDLSTGDFQGVGGCDNGVHTIVANFPTADGGTTVPRFGVTVWGWGNGITFAPCCNGTEDQDPKYTRWVSYAYPAGANFSPLNNVVLTP
jgi:IgGFc binding protein